MPYHLWAKNVASGGCPPTSFRNPKNIWGKGYISYSQVKYFSEISWLIPPQIFQD